MMKPILLKDNMIVCISEKIGNIQNLTPKPTTATRSQKFWGIHNDMEIFMTKLRKKLLQTMSSIFHSRDLQKELYL